MSDARAAELAEAAALLDTAADDYRVLRRVRLDRERFCECGGDPGALKTGLILDTETTGLDPTKDEIIELGLLAFEFDTEGRIYKILGSHSGFQQSSKPIPPEITKLTGITDEMVAGQAIEDSVVEAFIDESVVVIAHKAEFDRVFAERRWPSFAEKAWACSWSQIDWRAEGFEGSGLAYLLMGIGQFHEGHRAEHDCRALLEVLASKLPNCGELALKRLLDTARKPAFRIAALGTPFARKDTLKSRGYRWNTGDDGTDKCWWIEVEEPQRAAEIEWIRKEIYRGPGDLKMLKVNAFNRFSERSARCAPLSEWQEKDIDAEAIA